MKFGLKEETFQKIQNVFADFSGVESVLIYGSRAKGNFKPGSDIDLIIKGNLTQSTVNRIELKLDDLDLPYTFDLSIFSHIQNKELLEHIERVGVEFYSCNNQASPIKYQ